MPMRYLSWQIRLRLPMVLSLAEAFLYHYGIGVTGASRISLDKFGEFCYQFLDNIDQVELYIGKTDTIAHLNSFRGMSIDCWSF